MSVRVKAFLYKEWEGKPVEIRRFPVDQDVSTSYAYLLQKIAQVFPSVKADKVAVAWVDGDGDRITISSDAELLEAMDQFDGSVFRIQIRDTSSSACTNAPLESSARQDKPATSTGSREGLLHVGVVCDGCGGSIYGTRYKCHVCRDYDLCTACKDRGWIFLCIVWISLATSRTRNDNSIGKAVASVLEPLGISVDVVDERKPSSEGAAPKEAYSASDIDEDQIQIAVAQLRSMGYEEEGGWLTELVKAKKGNVEHVLEALHPSQ
ncbi:hypothetical protein EMCRGX_G033210 [Ephydatia muelleri]